MIQTKARWLTKMDGRCSYLKTRTSSTSCCCWNLLCLTYLVALVKHTSQRGTPTSSSNKRRSLSSFVVQAMSRNNNIRLLEGAELSSSKQASPNLHAQSIQYSIKEKKQHLLFFTNSAQYRLLSFLQANGTFHRVVKKIQHAMLPNFQILSTDHFREEL